MPLMSLALPIVLSAVLVFVVSSIIHMVLTYHRNDVRSVPREADVMGAMRPFDIPPGDYAMPHAGSINAMKDLAFLERMNKGPVVFMTVLPNGPTSMGKSLVQWFIYSMVIGLFSGYIASRALDTGAQYLEVFRFVGASAFMAYAVGLAQNSIWYRRNWGMTLRSMFDGLIYALVTAGTFGWLWPR